MIAPMTARALLRHLLLLAAVFAAVPAQLARAADASDSGWFDPQTPSAASNAATPAPPPPPAEGKPVPGDGRELPSLAPSPLLQDRGGQAQAPSQTQVDPQETNPRALTEFRSQLDPYGTWVQHPTYGTIWVPSPSVVGTGFYPYVSSGHWALDEDSNWVWVSDFSFGRVVFHYGRWVWVGNSWGWVPGYRYAPAWVSWRVPTGSYAYVGWSPLGPSYLWFNGYAVSYWYGGYRPWVYCPSNYVFHRSVNYYVVRDRALVGRLGAHTRVYAAASPRIGAHASRAVVSPSLSAARVPARSVPTTRIAASSHRAAAVPGARAERFSQGSRFDRVRPQYRGGESADRVRSFHSDRVRTAPVPRAGGDSSWHRSTPSAGSFDRGSRPSSSGSRPSFGSGGGSRPSFGGGGSRPSFGGGGGSRPSFGGGSHGGGGHGRR